MATISPVFSGAVRDGGDGGVAAAGGGVPASAVSMVLRSGGAASERAVSCAPASATMAPVAVIVGVGLLCGRLMGRFCLCCFRGGLSGGLLGCLGARDALGFRVGFGLRLALRRRVRSSATRASLKRRSRFSTAL